MTTVAMPRLTAVEIEALDPYQFMAVLGKRVIHPGGRRSTEEMFRLAGFQAGQHVLDVGCGVGTTAIELARRFGCRVTAVDIDPHMLDRARANVRATGTEGSVTVERADIQALHFPDKAFARVVVEAVTMFVDRPQAAKEVVRVCRPGGRVLEHEFIWRRPPTPAARRLFEGDICPGIRFDTPEDWIQLYQGAGLRSFQSISGPFAMMTPLGFLRDEGVVNCLAIMGRMLSRWAYLRKMAWMMPRMVRVIPYLGYVTLSGEKPT